ncbi:protein YaiN [Klebsiella oxytoca]|uniref:formaldehyde-responsive transcriptional repressor FrmR n=1 Tax=Klebsiella TaxID=570 RepID=UPI0007CC7062|nr:MULTISPECIES: formaldehyde-responsive transcriptional repressor FrmR [Klebsiella]SAQ15123.1 protein YaiN [Klebsiella oxytoca]HBX4002881.1 DNA-binding transcriptional repressor FrmR [Klebsiella variicola]MBZ6862043.1 formaldehyde-responsive transcriptional repressor FrmR [Klebsiella michiganensis]MBZ7423113.1 formaldehyde-responsive transcriptional repressor FrmR [Klebsiella michiganensis]MDU4139616.1 formaldehyde-responsive transcriptional repressor FrmR [Klebsiella michiganensis]
MPHSPEEKKQALTRVRRIKGQIAALEQALENEEECSSVLQQLASVRGAVNGLMAVVLESYLREEFPDTGKRSESQKKSIDDTISIVRSYLR